MEFLKEWISWTVHFLRDFAWGIFSPYVEDFMALLPEAVVVNMSYIQSWYAPLNGWVPMDEFIIIWSAYITFLIALVTVKWIIKAIPFVG